MLKNTLLCAVCVSVSALAVTANAVQIGKPITVPLNITQKGISSPQQTTVVLMNIQLDAQQQKALNNYNPKPFTAADVGRNATLPPKKQLGMNNVPVLNQGMHGSCVTFAETAALDAILGKGDYVSPLCSLQLGNYLEQNSYMPSGWNGSLGPIVLDQMMRFGVVSIENQKSQSCGGLKEYPTTDGNTPSGSMSLSEYQNFSHDLYYDLYINYLMNFDQRFNAEFDGGKVDKVVNEVKEALYKGNRVTFGTMLKIPPGFTCTAGACAKHNARNDTWALTSELNNPQSDMGGHEMVITGYDDTAVAVDNEGKEHQGLFTLRNSWGDRVGDKGDFYMTYDYFKKYAGEAQVLVAR